MWMIELNPFFRSLMTPLTFDQPGCWKLAEKKKIWQPVTTNFWCQISSKVPDNSSTYLLTPPPSPVPHNVYTFILSPLSSTCSPLLQHLQKLNRGYQVVTRSTSLHPSTTLTTHGSSCNSILFKSHPPPFLEKLCHFISIVSVCSIFSFLQAFFFLFI